MVLAEAEFLGVSIGTWLAILALGGTVLLWGIRELLRFVDDRKQIQELRTKQTEAQTALVEAEGRSIKRDRMLHKKIMSESEKSVARDKELAQITTNLAEKVAHITGRLEGQ